MQPTEAVYVAALLEAYSERAGVAFGAVDQVAGRTPFADHLGRSRVEFYSAEALRAFSRDNLPNGAFEELKEEVMSGVADVVESDHRDSFERVLKTIAQAKSLPLDVSVLNHRTTTRDKGGICHQLVNDRKVRWVRK